MIKHVVMWKLKEKNKEENAKEMVKRLNNLNEKIDGVVSLETGIDITKSERNFDVVLYSEFKNKEALDSYRIHEAHKEVVIFIRSISEKVIAVDYEI